MRGSLIIIEGIDGAGKTTLIEFLKFVEFPTVTFRFPDRTSLIGRVIGSILSDRVKLNDKALQLLFSANRWELADEINDCLDEGVNVILDRYIYSGMAYGGTNYCFAADENLPTPDIILFLNISPEQVVSRNPIEKRKELFDNQNVQNRAYAEYLKMTPNNWIEIDATKSMADIVTQCRLLLRTFLESKTIKKT